MISKSSNAVVVSSNGDFLYHIAFLPLESPGDAYAKMLYTGKKYERRNIIARVGDHHVFIIRDNL